MNDQPPPPEFDEHALEQMRSREISDEEVMALVRSVEPFLYNQRGTPQLGFYDETSRLFVAVAEGKVVTVFRARASYIAALKRRT